MATRVEATSARAAGAAAGGVVVLAVLSLSHFVNDSFTAMLTPLLPEIQQAYAVSIARTAVLVAILAFAGSMLQPFVGLVADRLDRRVLAALGPVLAGVGMTLMGYAPSFAALGALIALAGVGSAIFHPSGAAYVTRGARDGLRGLFAALFSAA